MKMTQKGRVITITLTKKEQEPVMALEKEMMESKKSSHNFYGLYLIARRLEK